MFNACYHHSFSKLLFFLPEIRGCLSLKAALYRTLQLYSYEDHESRTKTNYQPHTLEAIMVFDNPNYHSVMGCSSCCDDLRSQYAGQQERQA
jgi:hypothetical protein